ALAFMAMASVDPQISRNLTDATRARYVAEAGIEVAFGTLVSDGKWDSYLPGGCAGPGKVLGAANTTLPGLTAASGTYTVSIRNDCQAGDDLLTGVALDPTETDANNRVIVTAVGTFRTATQTIQVVVSRVPNLLSADAPAGGQLSGALSFPGVQTDMLFSGFSFTVDGRDYTLADVVTSGKPLYGIAVSDAAHETIVQAALNNQAAVTGLDQTRGGDHVATGNATIAATADLTSQAVADFVSRVKPYADVDLYSDKTKGGLSFANIG